MTNDSYYSLEMVLDGDGLLDIPYIGERLRKSSAGVPTARGKWISIVVKERRREYSTSYKFLVLLVRLINLLCLFSLTR